MSAPKHIATRIIHRTNTMECVFEREWEQHGQRYLDYMVGDYGTNNREHAIEIAERISIEGQP